MTSRQLNITSVYRRLTQIILAIVLLITVLNMWVSADSLGKELQTRTSDQASRSLAQQSAMMARHFIEQKNIANLTTMLNDMASTELIIQAMVYDNKGTLITQSNNAVTAHQSHLNHTEPFDALTPINQPDSQNAATAVISPITGDDQLLGYLRINYALQQALLEPVALQHQIMRKILLMFLICGVMGFLLTKGFSRFSRNSFRIIERK